MIKRNNTAKVIISCSLALFFWTFTCLNKELFYVYDGGGMRFRLGYFLSAMGCSAAVGVLGSLKVCLGNKARRVVGVLVYIASLFGAMEISILFSDGFTSGLDIFFFNMVFYAAAAGIGLLISGSLRASAITALAVSYTFNGICFIVYCLRGSPLTPTDISAFGTAMNVAANYEFKLRYQMITATAAATALIMLAFKFPIGLWQKTGRRVMRCFGAAAAALCVAFIALSDFSEYDVSEYDQYYANLTYGATFSFYVNSTKIGLDESETYDPEKLEEILLSYGDEESGSTAAGDDKPNIIVIMNESFADLKAVGDFKTNEDYMPYFRSLKKNTVKGTLFVSPFGGYTCNTEYEFLTGMSVGVLGSRTTPYLQSIFEKLPYSLNTHLKALGYRTTALHPYYADGWNRTLVYDCLSFDRFISLENFTDYSSYPEYIRGYISDKSSYDAVLNLLYRKDPEYREFIFNITMQNHGGYTDDTYESKIFLQDMVGQYPETEQYLTLIKESDDALKYLLDNLKDFDEPTIVMMFGDHMPNVEREFYEELYGAPLEEVDGGRIQMRYMVPFMMWANYDIDEDDGVYTSPCYLSNMIMEAAGLPKSRVQLWLDDMSSVMSQLNPMGYYDPEGYWHSYSDTDKDSEYYDMEYALLTGEPLSYDFEYPTEETGEPYSPDWFGDGFIHPYEYGPRRGYDGEDFMDQTLGLRKRE